MRNFKSENGSLIERNLGCLTYETKGKICFKTPFEICLTFQLKMEKVERDFNFSPVELELLYHEVLENKKNNDSITCQGKKRAWSEVEVSFRNHPETQNRQLPPSRHS